MAYNVTPYLILSFVLSSLIMDAPYIFSLYTHFSELIVQPLQRSETDVTLCRCEYLCRCESYYLYHWRCRKWYHTLDKGYLFGCIISYFRPDGFFLATTLVLIVDIYFCQQHSLDNLLQHKLGFITMTAHLFTLTVQKTTENNIKFLMKRAELNN